MGDPPRPDALASTLDATGESDELVGTVAPVAGTLISLAAGSLIGRYQVLERLGAGGMGVVYKAYDPEIDRAVAVKLLGAQRAGQRAQARLLREAVALGRLSHPNVVTVHDVGSHDAGVFIAMELVSGPNLSDWLAGEQRSLSDILATFVAAGRGLAAAHDAGIVHRDFKPSNAVIGEDGRVRVLDFGLAREDGQAPDDSPATGDVPVGALTVTGAVLGTPRFMAPEQLRGEPADERSDQFSFCVSLWWALYGESPFSGDSLAALLEATGRPPKPPPAPPIEVPGWIRELLLRGLNADPALRHPSMAALLDALSRDPRARRRRILAGAGIVALAGLAAVGTIRGFATDSGAESTLCKSAPDELRRVWSGAVGQQLRAAFDASGSPLAADAADRVLATLDRYGDSWVAMRTESCRATHVRGTQSAALLDLRMHCLDERLAEVEALVEVLGEDPDREVVGNAVAAAHQLSELELCADPEALRARVPLPADRATRARIETLDHQLRRQQALLRAGRYQQLLAEGARLEHEVEELGFAPLVARLLLVRGEARAQLVQTEAARGTLERTIAAAASARDDYAAARAWTWLMFVDGVLDGHPEAALGHRLAAEAAAVRADDAVATIWLLNTLGAIHAVAGRPDLARSLLQQAVARLPESSDPFQRVMTLNNLAANLQVADELSGAFDAYGRAAREAAAELGASHPLHGFILINQGQVANLVGRGSDARALCDRGLAVYRPLEPEGGAETARALVCGAAARLGSGAASALIERAEALERQHETRPEFVARRQFVQAQVLWPTDPDRARQLAGQALEFYRKAPDTPASVLAAVEAWVRQHP